jgi:hypothetical protein
VVSSPLIAGTSSLYPYFAFSQTTSINTSITNIAYGYVEAGPTPTGTNVKGNTGPTLYAPTSPYRPVFYNSATSTLVYDTATDSTNKTFVVEHPLDENKYLVHGCLEGPEVGVYYRGSGTIGDTLSTVVDLPPYVEKMASDFTVHVTPIDGFANLYATRIRNNQFRVHSNSPVDFDYVVYGRRKVLDVEPPRETVQVHGNGPYTWIEPK